MTENIQTLVEIFFKNIWILIESTTVEMIDSDINIRVQTPDSALLIGMHGKNIESFQHLLGRMIEKMTSSHIHVHLEVNDYMKEKDARLFRFLDSKIEFVMSTGKSTRIPNLTSYERKKAHGYIAEKNTLGLSTKSDGEWTERALILEYCGELKKIAQPIASSVINPVVSPPKSTTPIKTETVHNISEEGVGI